LALLIDSSVWIDFFNGLSSRETDYVTDQLGRRLIVTGDLILAEVLQGFRRREHFEKDKNALLAFPVFNMVCPEIAIKSSDNYQLLRKKGITVRKTIDCLIATFCIESGLELLHADSDYDGFEDFLNLRVIHP